MQSQDYFFLVQNVLMIIFTHLVVLCKGKKAKATVGRNSNESLMVKSGIKPPTEGTTTTPISTVAKTEEKPAEKPADDAKKEDKKEEAKKEDKKDPIAQSQKPFPKFVMPTESARKKKEKENEEDKNKKIKEGFYQAKSDEDDTLEKIESLKVEKSDKTKRSQKAPKKT